MPSATAKERRTARRVQQQDQSVHQNCVSNCTVDGKQQVDPAGSLEMQRTASRHGEQSEQHCPPTKAQETAHRDGGIQLDDGPLTHVLTEFPMRKPAHTQFNKSLPNTSVLIQQVKTKYVIGTKGLSEIQITRACDKAFTEVWNDMEIVWNKQYSAEIRAAFATNVYNKACRIVEAKRRRCARSTRQPKVTI